MNKPYVPTPEQLELIAELDKINKDHSICNIHKKEDGTVTCRRGHLCCGGCRHLTDKGCSVLSVPCKLFLCPQAFNSPHIPPEVKDRIKEIWAQFPFGMAERYDGPILTANKMWYQKHFSW